MGYVIRLKRSQLVGGSNNDEIYPITATNAVYRGGKNLEEILDEISSDKQSGTLTIKQGDEELGVFNPSNGDSIIILPENSTAINGYLNLETAYTESYWGSGDDRITYTSNVLKIHNQVQPNMPVVKLQQTYFSDYNVSLFVVRLNIDSEKKEKPYKINNFKFSITPCNSSGQYEQLKGSKFYLVISPYTDYSNDDGTLWNSGSVTMTYNSNREKLFKLFKDDIGFNGDSFYGFNSSNSFYPLSFSNLGTIKNGFSQAYNSESILEVTVGNERANGFGSFNITTGEYTASQYTAPYIYLKPWYQ